MDSPSKKGSIPRQTSSPTKGPKKSKPGPTVTCSVYNKRIQATFNNLTQDQAAELKLALKVDNDSF